MKNNDDIAIVVQARLNSQRLPNKMLKPFVNTTLFNLLLDKLNNSSLIDNKKVYLSIYEDELKQASAGYGFNIYNRSYQSANEDNDIRVIYEWYKDIKEKYVVLISACNPLLKIETIENFIKSFSNSSNAGAFAVFEKKTYYWDKQGKPITDWKGNKIMNTKIVEPIYEAAHCLYASKTDLLYKECWMGESSPPEPKLFVMDELEAFDIDYEWQFKVGEQLYENL
mgnify:FL=1